MLKIITTYSSIFILPLYIIYSKLPHALYLDKRGSIVQLDKRIFTTPGLLHSTLSYILKPPSLRTHTESGAQRSLQNFH